MSDRPTVTTAEEINRQAVSYWKAMHPHAEIIPVGEINGITHCALKVAKEAMANWQASQGSPNADHRSASDVITDLME